MKATSVLALAALAMLGGTATSQTIYQGPWCAIVMIGEGSVAERCDIRAVVLTSGSGRSLSVGSDVKGFPATAEAGREVSEAEHAAYDALAALPQPMVAALRGHTDLVIACVERRRQ